MDKKYNFLIKNKNENEDKNVNEELKKIINLKKE